MDFEPFDRLIETIRAAYPTCYVDDRRRTLLHDPSLIVAVAVGPHNPNAKQFHFVTACVSIIAPFYVVHGAPRGGRLGAFLDELVRQTFEVRSLPPELGHERIPDIAVGNVEMGETTIGDALFSPDR
ncbi:MAG: hypothetical protein AAGA48_11570 [Myxococcota bacterium]